MLKHVYEETRYLTRENLFKLLRTINFVNPKKEEILSIFGVDIDNTDLSDVEASIVIDNYIKNVNMIFNYLNFEVLDIEERLDQSEKQRLLNKLKGLEINVGDDVIYSLKKIFEEMKNETKLIDDLNKSEINENSLRYLLDKYKINYTYNDIQNLLKIFNGIVYKAPTYLPTTRNKYYDINNNLISIIEVMDATKNTTTLRNFEGEIYEKLDFKNDEEAQNYVATINNKISPVIKTIDKGYGMKKDIVLKPHEIKETFDEEFKTYIHFKGEMDDEDWYDEIHIFKQKSGIIVKYGGIIPLNLRSQDKSITVEEINDVITLLHTKCPYNEVTRYAIRELRNLKKVIEIRKYKKKENIIDRESLVKISSILANEEYGDERNIYFKMKIISSEPLKLKKEKTLIK